MDLWIYEIKINIKFWRLTNDLKTMCYNHMIVVCSCLNLLEFVHFFLQEWMEDYQIILFRFIEFKGKQFYIYFCFVVKL